MSEASCNACAELAPDNMCTVHLRERACAALERERARGKAREPKCTTLAHARWIVEEAPGGCGPDAIATHVQRFLRDAYDEGKRDGHALARESLLRSELAFHEGNASRSAGSANETRNELNTLLVMLGKSRVFPP